MIVSSNDSRVYGRAIPLNYGMTLYGVYGIVTTLNYEMTLYGVYGRVTSLNYGMTLILSHHNSYPSKGYS